MAPLTPTWKQPSHPEIQKVLFAKNPHDYMTKSISKISLEPFAIYAKFEFPPCTEASEATYATVQTGKDEHLNLNSDLVYINHSCEPSLIFDTAKMQIIVGPRGLKAGDELTFFYPSTEWAMAQGFACICAAPSCRGFIAGAKSLAPANPATLTPKTALWLNKHITKQLKVPGDFAPSQALEQAKALWTAAQVGHGIGSRELSGEMGGDTNGKAF
ncbi:hypothetical protein B0O99DRAFT_610180 [Bisporella sp. PMI_857]|nr:hypothetical protein B0O99DRAFT_610180 [Bisporella sp. PMI_857]